MGFTILLLSSPLPPHPPMAEQHNDLPSPYLPISIGLTFPETKQEHEQTPPVLPHRTLIHPSLVEHSGL